MVQVKRKIFIYRKWNAQKRYSRPENEQRFCVSKF